MNHADPWAIYVSEVMLQQTSVDRVREPWRRFLDEYPSPHACANATLADVLNLWSGLGYPRRARNLHAAAQMMVRDFDGRVPSAVADLRRLPGVGPYTAHAVASFAFGARVGVLDTNVGRVLARCVTNNTLSTADAQGLANALVGRAASAPVNQGLIDVGAQFCRSTPRCGDCPLRDVCRWRQDGGPDPAIRSAGVSRPQPRFEGSVRQARGRLLAALRDGPLSVVAARRVLNAEDPEMSTRVLRDLQREGLVSQHGRRVHLGS